MGHYKSNVRDIAFNLFEVFGSGALLGREPYAELDEATAREMLDQLAQLAEGPLAESFADADRNPPVFDPDTHSVTLPESFKQSWRTLVDSEFWRLDALPELGGQAAPRGFVWAMGELVLGANPALYMYLAGVPSATILYRNGTPDQKRLAQHVIDRGWSMPMVLTEPDAGSDVGAGRTKAIAQPDGTWHLEGVKRFITSAEHDLTENIVHFVLARPEGAGPGTKGLSMFVVPKYLVDLDTGELGARNGVYVTNVEHKMGMKVSTTCELRFGEDEPAIGYLLGDVHDGIAQMFQVIENARMMVGSKAIATLSTGYLNALEFARARVQSADLTQMNDKTAPRVTIIHHPDVRRSLMLNKAYAEGLRALVAYTANVQDRIIGAANDETNSDPTLDEAINDLLLPLVKGVGSERSYEQLAQSLQTFGGSGYLQDYPLEQYLRDSKIDTLYEGTTAIQGLDFFFRKIVRNRGAALNAVAAEITAFLDSIEAEGRLKDDSAAVRDALANVRGMVVAMTGQLAGAIGDPRNVYKVGQNTTRLLLAAGDLMVGYLLLRQAAVALTALAADDVTAADREFYEGKPAVAHFFAATVLPELAARRLVVESTDNALMDLPDASF